ncbi:MAG: NnrU family protein [Pseudomonadota bacterium]
MTLLIAGMVVFMLPHLAPRLLNARDALIARLGEGGYKIAYSVVSLIGLVMIVYGYKQAPVIPIYEPLENRLAIAHAVMPFAFVLFAGGHMKSNLKRWVRHPMSWGALLWSVTHLANRGDVASLILFGGFAVFAVLSMVLISAQTVREMPAPRAPVKDVILIGAGLVAYAVALVLHGVVGGVYVFG